MPDDNSISVAFFCAALAAAGTVYMVTQEVGRNLDAIGITAQRPASNSSFSFNPKPDFGG